VESTQRLVARDGTGGDRFGASTAIDGDRMAIGAPGVAGIGAVYLFERANGEWNEVAKVEPPGASVGDEFGLGVALAGTTLVVGTNNAGAYMFQFHSGEWIHSLTHPGSTSISGAVAVSNGVVAIGDDRANNVTGAVHVYERAR
jgi:hypothetical protein